MTTIQSMCDSYVSNSSSKYIYKTKNVLDKFCKRYGRLSPKRLQSSDSFLSKYTNPNTKNTFGRIIHAATGVGFTKSVGRSARHRYFSDEELQQFTAAIKDANFADFFNCLVATGARPSEIASVTLENVVFGADNTVFFQLPTSKNGRKRTIYLPKSWQNWVKTRVQTIQNKVENTCFPVEKHLFLTQKDKVWDQNKWNWCFKSALSASKLAGLVIYSTRHTFITRMLSKGVPIAQVAALVGNSVAVLERHYNHLTQESKILQTVLDN